MPAPCYFEIHADDCGRAQKFYGDVFSWSFTPFFSRSRWSAVMIGSAITPPRRQSRG